MKKILIPVDDFDFSLRAIELAGLITSGEEAEIIVLHLADPGEYKSKEDFKIELSKMVEFEIRPKLKKATTQNPSLKKVRLEVKALESDVTRHIIEFAEEEKVNLIVMASLGLPSADKDEQFLEETVSYQVVLESSCPVFTFTSIPENMQFKKILLPLDLTEGSKYKVPTAVELAKQFESDVHILSAHENLSDKELKKLEDIHTEVGEVFSNEGINVEHEIIQGKRLDNVVIAKSEKMEADLVIIMSRPSNMWSELFITPGSKRIISFSKIPVLSIRLKSWGSGL